MRTSPRAIGPLLQRPDTKPTRRVAGRTWKCSALAWTASRSDGARTRRAFAACCPRRSCASSRSARRCPSCPATSPARSAAATSRSGIVAGAFAFTAIIARPFGGRLADRRGRRPVAIVGMAARGARRRRCTSCRSACPGSILARLVLGIGQGWVFTAGLAWTVDLAPRRAARPGDRATTGSACGAGCRSARCSARRRARRRLVRAGVGARRASLPLVGAAIASRCPSAREQRPRGRRGRRRPAARARRSGPAPRSSSRASATRRSRASSCCTSRSSASAHGAAVFTAFASTVVVDAARARVAARPRRRAARPRSARRWRRPSA